MGSMTSLIIATRNFHKVNEIRNILGTQFRCSSLEDFRPAPLAHEDGNTFAQNATKKAVELATWFSISAAPKEGADINQYFVPGEDSALRANALTHARGFHS